MRQDNRAALNLTGIVQQIEIQRARRVRNGTLAPEVRFDLMQKFHQSNGLETGAERGDRVHERWIGRVGPGLAFIERRNSGDFDAGAGQNLERRFQTLGGRARGRRDIGAQTY